MTLRSTTTATRGYRSARKKLRSSSVLRCPAQRAACGDAHSRQVRSTTPLRLIAETQCTGRLPGFCQPEYTYA
jgi:hypothetical protein